MKFRSLSWFICVFACMCCQVVGAACTKQGTVSLSGFPNISQSSLYVCQCDNQTSGCYVFATNEDCTESKNITIPTGDGYPASDRFEGFVANNSKANSAKIVTKTGEIVNKIGGSCTSDVSCSSGSCNPGLVSECKIEIDGYYLDGPCYMSVFFSLRPDTSNGTSVGYYMKSYEKDLSRNGRVYLNLTDGLLYRKNESNNLEQYTNLNHIPRLQGKMVKFTGFYTGTTTLSRGIQFFDTNGKFLKISGQDIEDLLMSFSTILLYGKFYQLSTVLLKSDEADVTVGTYQVYVLSGTTLRDACGMWLNPYGEDEYDEYEGLSADTNTYDFVEWKRTGYALKGFYDTYNLQWVNFDGSLDNGKKYACTVSTIPNSLTAEWIPCREDQYLDGGACKQCPNNPGANTGYYNFVKLNNNYGGITSCVLEFDLNKSRCAEGMLVYGYDDDEKVYKKLGDSAGLSANEGEYVFEPEDDSTLTEDVATQDLCVVCDKNNGYYADKKTKSCAKCGLGYYVDGTDVNSYECQKCPNLQAGSETSVYGFIEYDNGYGITSCAVKFMKEDSACKASTNVVYVYDNDKTKYIRTADSKIEASVTSKINDDIATDYLPEDFCTRCGAGEYVKNGQCIYCSVPDYIWIGEGEERQCVPCPAGYSCSSENYEETMCSANEYSEEGHAECAECASGYSTSLSGPDYDGLCLGRQNGYGIGCVSSKACKLTNSSLCVNNTSNEEQLKCFFLDENIVKIKSINKSVLQSMQKTSNN